MGSPVQREPYLLRLSLRHPEANLAMLHYDEDPCPDVAVVVAVKADVKKLAALVTAMRRQILDLPWMATADGQTMESL